MESNQYEIERFESKFKTPTSRNISSLSVLLYIWLLPVLANIGFAEKDATTISGFIANAHATGVLAALYFTPLCLMWEYQSYLLTDSKYDKNKLLLYYTLSFYQFFYGSFLVCTVTYVPEWLHTLTVVLFCIASVLHSIMIMYLVPTSIIAKLDLIIGCISAFCLIFVKGL